MRGAQAAAAPGVPAGRGSSASGCTTPCSPSSDSQRAIESVRCQLVYGRAEPRPRVHDAGLPTAEHAAPEVSVVVTLYNYADVVTETLDSIAASTDVDVEIVVVDDHSTDDGRDVVRQFMDAHPDVPVLLARAGEQLRPAPGPQPRHRQGAGRQGDDPRRRQRRVPDVPAPPRRRPRRGPRRQLRLRHARGVRRRAGAAQPPAVARPVAVRGELPRRPGDDPPRRARAPRRLPRRTSGSTAGRTGTCGCASPSPASAACTSPRCSAATAPSARR